MIERKPAPVDMDKPTFSGEILLCEDNIMNQQVICEHLARVGIDTVVAENGKIGLDMVFDRKQKGEKQFDLIFMDIHMPVMDGIEASAKILELNTGIPIVALTANIMSHDRELYKNSGMIDYVGKPFTSQELWRCLMRFFTPISWQTEDKSKHTQSENELRNKLINNFVNNNRDKHKEITDAMNAGDIKLAHRLAHTLKSNAGQLSKTALQKVSEDIESALADGVNNVTSQQLEVFERELASVIAEFEPMIQKAAPPPSAAEPLDAGAAQKLLEELKPLLEVGNPECLSLIDSLRAIQGSEELVQKMEAFDFKAAMETLAKLMKEG
jgi:CheY-like chemotaxis protein